MMEIIPRIFLCLTILFLHSAAPAQAQNPITQRPLNDSEQINAAIELMSKIKNVVARSHADRVKEAYKRIAIQSFKCAVLYGMLAKDTPGGGANATTYSNVSRILGRFSASIYPDPASNYNSEINTARDELVDLRKSNEKQKMFYLLRNCSELVEAEGQTLQNAISELMIK
jgi:hypothetical protein